MKKTVTLIISTFFILRFCNPVLAQWSTVPDVDNNLNATVTDFSSCTDGNGGAIYVYVKNYSETDVFVNRIDKDGIIKWGSGGITINASAGNQSDAYVCEDGFGGCYVAYQDYTVPAPAAVWVQHLDSNGVKLWAGNGVSAFNIAGTIGQDYLTLVNNNGSGVFVTITPVYFGGSDGVYSQKINFNGALQWGSAGSRVKIPYYERNPVTVADGSGGLVITWFSAYTLRAQRLNSSGARQWDTANYYLNSPGMSILANQKIIRDADNNFIISWAGSIAGTTTGNNIYAQKINKAGTKLWGANPVAVCDTAVDQGTPELITDSIGGAYITWVDLRTPVGVYAQRLNATGVKQWEVNGKKIFVTENYYTSVRMCADVNKGAKIFKYASETGVPYSHLRIQSVNADGSFNTPAAGLEVSHISSGFTIQNSIVAQPNSEAILFTLGAPTTGNDLYAKKIPKGCLSEKPLATPVSTACSPNRAILNWQGHLFSTYEVRYKKTTDASWITIGNIGHVNNYTFNGLQPNTDYKFQVRASCDYNGSKTTWANKNKTTQNCLVLLNTTESSNAQSHNGMQVKVYPNPAASVVTLRLPFVQNTNALLQITDIAGRKRYTATPVLDGNIFTVDVSKWENGIYLFQLEISGERKMYKIVVLH